MRGHLLLRGEELVPCSIPGCAVGGDHCEKNHRLVDGRCYVCEDRPRTLPPADEEPEQVESHAVLVPLSRVTPRQVEWLWPGRIPLGKLTIIAGDPGLMKSMLSLDITARVSQGAAWPDGGHAPQGKVLLLTAEDDLDDTVRPRLDSLGADVTRVTALTMVRTEDGEKSLNLRDHLPLLERALEPETRLIVIDPLLAFVGATDTHVSAQVRGLLAPLAALAARRSVAIVGIIHLNKRIAGGPFQRILASIDFSAAARSVLLVGEDEEDSDLRHLAIVKNNLALPAPTLSYRWGSEGFSWAGVSDRTASQLLTAPVEAVERDAVTDAAGFLGDLLAGGAVAVCDIQKEARAAGLSWRTVERAKAALGVQAQRQGEPGVRGGGQWVWAIKSVNTATVEHMAALTSSDVKRRESRARPPDCPPAINRR